MTPSALAQSRAATAITNVAQASFLFEGAATSAASNAVALQVAELLDIGLSSTASDFVAASDNAAVPFTLWNRGNGNERFLLDGSASVGRITGYAIDSDGDGTFDPAKDTLLSEAATAALSPGATLALFALIADVPASGATVTVTARAATASGTPGALAAGGGDGGVDAIVGSTAASATLRFSIAAGAIGGGVEATLEKTQSVWNAGGETAPMHGAVVIYTLTARFTRGTADDAVIADPIPAGTRYVPGSLVLDGAAVSDAADTDAASFDGSTVRAALGSVTAPAAHTLQFKVSIQ